MQKLDKTKNINKCLQEEIESNIKANLEKTIEKSLATSLKTLGINNYNHPEMQRDFYFLHKLRKRCEESSSLFFRIVLSSTIAAMAIALWEGIKVLLKR